MCFFFGRPAPVSPLRTGHRPLAALNHSLSDPTLSGLIAPISGAIGSPNNGTTSVMATPAAMTLGGGGGSALSPSLQSMAGTQSHSSSLAADPLSLTLRSPSSPVPPSSSVTSDGNIPRSVVPWTIADRSSAAAKRAARSAAFPLRYTSSSIDQNATEKGNP
jgi:hypothetical protein